MTASERTTRICDITAEVVDLLGSNRQVTPFAVRYPGFDLADAYAVAALVRDRRQLRGETAIGRKIGFTNRAVWSGYGISGPIWNYMFDTTVHHLDAAGHAFHLGDIPEPRIEPEIALHLCRAPRADMAVRELLECVDWVGHAFEIVHSVFPGWRFAASDAVAAFGVHTALLLGPPAQVETGWDDQLASFTVRLSGSDGTQRHGGGANVLGSPLEALRFLATEIERYGAEPLKPGEIITTGTLTDAMPISPGQQWRTELTGIALGGVEVRIS